MKARISVCVALWLSLSQTGCPLAGNPGEDDLDPAVLIGIIGGGVSAGVLEAPIFSLPGGIYNQSESLTISAPDAAATILYTTDGSDPASGTGLSYSGPITMARGGTYRAIAVRSGWTPSATTAVEYTVRAAVFDVTVRDFLVSHPDFEDFVGADSGIVQANLGADGLPVYASAGTTPTTSGAANFNQWFRNVSGVNTSVSIALPVASSPTTCYYNSASFFPIDGQGHGNEGNPHNYHFTTQTRTWARVDDGAVIAIYGDDDWWVFLNGKLAIDMGGVHGASNGSITLNSATRAAFGLNLGDIVRIDIFQAERHTTQSNFRISISSECYRF